MTIDHSEHSLKHNLTHTQLLFVNCSFFLRNIHNIIQSFTDVFNKKEEVNHLSKATNNKREIEELERNLCVEIGVLKGLGAERYSFDTSFSKEQEKQENLCKMQQAAQAFFHIDDPSFFESHLQKIWKNQEPYINSLVEEIAEKKSLQKTLEEVIHSDL